LAAGHKVRARVADYPPYMLKEPELGGLAVDYLDRIAERFGFEVEYFPADITFGAAVEDVAEGQRHYDLLLTFTPTPEREKRFAITDDYLSAPWVIFGIATMSQEGRNAILDKWVSVEMEPPRDYRLALAILIAAALALAASAYWNRLLAREIATRKDTESKLRQSEILLLGYAELMSRQLESPAEKQIKIIRDSGNHLLEVINDILTYSREEARRVTLQLEPVSLRHLTEHLKAVYAPVAERTKNRFVIELSDDSVDWVMADQARLTRILRNLLDNAFKFTAGGEVLLEVELIQPPTTQAAGADCVLNFAVSDTGIGIPSGKIDTLFQPFERLDRHNRMPGLGLGLAIAQQCATAMGSRFLVQSSRSGATGSTFAFQLRLPTGAADESLVGEECAIKGYVGSRRKLLIVDDQASSRELLAAR
jgi:signal transduction histidine kinase